MEQDFTSNHTKIKNIESYESKEISHFWNKLKKNHKKSANAFFEILPKLLLAEKIFKFCKKSKNSKNANFTCLALKKPIKPQFNPHFQKLILNPWFPIHILQK